MNVADFYPLIIQTLLSFVVPAFTTVLTYFVWHKQATKTDKTASCCEAYKAFYLPFITMLYQSQICDCGFSRLAAQPREALVQLIVNNIQYMEKNEVDYIDVLYGYYNCLKISEASTTSRHLFTPDRMDELFDAFIEQSLLRAEKLANMLNQPPLGRFVLDFYLDSQADLKKQREESTQDMDQP